MSKTTKRTIGTAAKAAKETKTEGFTIDKIIPAKYQTPVSLAILLILFLIFFAPMYFGGQTLQSGDIMTSKSMRTYVATHEDGFTLWNPYIFCGMPAYAMGVGLKWFNLVYVGFTGIRWLFTKFFSVEYTTYTLYLILLSFTSFLLMKYKTKNTLISLFTAIAASFSTGIIVFLFIGHITKLNSLCMYPLIFLMLLKFQKGIKLLDFAILTIALQIFVQGWHVQIIFYTFFAVGIYFVYYIVRSFVKKEHELRRQLLKSLGVFAAAAMIAVLIQSDNLTQIYEYSPYSTRGGKSVVENQASAAKGEPVSGQAYYDYHTQWSFSPGEVMTFFIPSYYGFGNSTYQGPLTNNQEYRVNTYFGQMEFVDVAMYMGVLVFLLGLYAIFTCWKDPFVQFLTILSGLALLISFGKNFSPVFDLMFYYFPSFDKFRVPSMMLVLVQLSFPFLAGIGLWKIINLRSEKDLRAEKIVKFAAFGFTGLLVLSFILSGVLSDWFTARLNESARNPQVKQLADYASDMFLTDTHIVLALAALTFGLALTYINKKISRDAVLLAVVVFTVFDLWRIDSRGAEYVQQANMDEAFREPLYISAIKAQNDKEPFRIINLKQDGSLGSVGNDANFNAYFLVQDLFGYSGIKPRAYQDIIDVVGTPANPTLWRMLNTKYIVFDRQINFTDLTQVSNNEKNFVYRYDKALPRAYFVNNVQVKPALQILNLIKNNAFDPKELAFLEEGDLKVDRPDTTQAYVKINRYKDEHISIQAKATGNNLLFLGDTYYPKGWKAFVDGNETKIYRVNHAFRGIVVPKGEHRIEFRFEPSSFFISQKIALILSAIVILGLFAGIYLDYKGKRKSLSNN